MTEIATLIKQLAPDQSEASKVIAAKFAASVLTKPFTILTGGSGTGKTALATRLAKSFELHSHSNEIQRPAFQEGDIIHGDRAQYSVLKISPEILTLGNKDGSRLPLPVDVVQEWIDAWDDGLITEVPSVREKRELVKAKSQFDANSHSWESHLGAIAKSGKGFGSDITRSNYAVVPVGADWTDNRQVLGFVNHLRKAKLKGTSSDCERPVFQTTPVLDLLLDATKAGNGTHPFFLILDEMNLSHVERYFADFLSVMEQREGKLILHSEGPPNDDNYRLPRYDGDPIGVPCSLAYPENLFVIGTVNVDETTYMFSPKVLDRANVIEFKVDKASIEEFLSDPHEYPAPEKAAAGVAEAFLALSKSARRSPAAEGLPALTDPMASELRHHLSMLFEILKRGRFEFGYRTANEVTRYLRVCRFLAESESEAALDKWNGGGWRDDLDAQILQKILPKLHGSIGRVGQLLASLMAYCGGAQTEAVFAYFPGGRDGTEAGISGSPLQNSLSQIEDPDYEFRASQEKLETMVRILLDEQFVSFIN